MSYSEAISDALVIGMRNDSRVFITGIGVDYSAGVFGTTIEAFREFGETRVFDAPSMENGLTGVCIGAASMGMRPILVHLRNDFMFLAFDQMINLASKWRYMYGGNAGRVPLVIRGIIGKGWGQGATHSQSLQSTLAHFPGIIVLMPATPADAKGLILSALKTESPVVILEHRSLYNIQGEVPQGIYETPIGKANILRVGSDVTIVCTSYMVIEAIKVADFLAPFGISVEVVDLRSIRPIDEETIVSSIKKTGKLIVADTSWIQYGVASEISAIAAEKAFEFLTAPILRVGLPDFPAPASMVLEEAFYPTAETLKNTVLKILNRQDVIPKLESGKDNFNGPY